MYSGIKKLLALIFLNRLYLFFISWIAVIFLPLRERPGLSQIGLIPDLPFLEGWTRWDGGWYVSIATQGYFFNPHEQSNVAFFPLYPLTIKLFMLVFKNPYLSGILVSNLAFFIGIFFFSKLLNEYLLKDEKKTFWSIFFLISFPYSLFFSAVYSESLFFLCSVLSFYFAERKNWTLSGIFGMLACADRFVGIALFPAIAVKFLESLLKEVLANCKSIEGKQAGQPSSFPSLIYEGIKGGISPLLSIGLIPLGLIAYMIFLYFKFNDPLAFAHTIGKGWEGMKVLQPDILLPFKSFINTIVNFPRLPDNKYHVVFQFPIYLFFLIMIFFVFKYLGWSYALFSFFMLFIPASVSIDLIGMGRYLLLIFPVFAVIPVVLVNKYLRIIIICASLFFLTLFTAMFATGWWVG